jgi:hypothetical protein
VNRSGGQPAGPPEPDPLVDGAAGLVDGPSLDDLSPEERAQAEAMIEQMADVQRQIAGTPAAQLVANHAMGFFELAAIKLSQEPPQFADAQLRSMPSPRCSMPSAHGSATTSRRSSRSLSQLQLAFITLRTAAPTPEGRTVGRPPVRSVRRDQAGCSPAASHCPAGRARLFRHVRTHGDGGCRRRSPCSGRTARGRRRPGRTETLVVVEAMTVPTTISARSY